MSKEQKGFIVYGDIQDVLKELDDEQVAQLFRGMVNYFVDGKAPKFTGVLKFVWIPIKQHMDRDAEKYEKRCEKNRENVKKRWERTNEYERIRTNTNDTNTKTKTNTNTKTETDTITTSSETDVSSLSSFLIEHLNEKTGSNYKTSSAVINQVGSLLAAGYSADQMRTVIDRKCDEWLTDEKMRTYLRPSTLFGDKFGEYLSAPISLTTERKQDEAKKKKSLEKELTEKRQSLDVLRSSLSEIPGGTRMDERRVLKEQIAQLEDSIRLIEGRLS